MMLGTYSHPTDLTPDALTTTRGGCIRFDGPVPRLHVNSSHQSVGIVPDSVRVNTSGHLVFNLDVSLPVVTVSVSPDETLVERGLTAGLSGGASECVIKFHLEGREGSLNLNNTTHYAKLAGSTSNVWVSVTSIAHGI